MIKTANNKRQALALAITVVTVATVNDVVALPTGHSTEQGTSSYNNGLLEFGEPNSVARFDTFNIGNLEVLRVRPNGICDASCAGMARVNTGPSILNGTLDLGMNFFLLNQNGIVFGNGFTLDTASVAASGMQPGLVATTYNIDSADFNAGNRSFGSGGSVQGIEVNGLNSLGSNNQLLLISHDIDINGNVSLPQGVFSAASGGDVEVLFRSSDNLLQFNITSALATVNGQQIINIGSGSTINAGQVNLGAIVADDVLSFAVNNQGVVSANGISVGDNGIVTLVGDGGVIFNRGEINAVDGEISINAKQVIAQGKLDAGNGDIVFEVGRSADGNHAAREGELRLGDNIDVQANSMTITGLGGRNKLFGLANYTVDGLNSGSAQLDNVVSIRFNDFSWLVGKSNVAHEFRVLSGGSLLDNFMGQAEGRIEGANKDDTFLIEGSVENLFGRIGDDTFTLSGGHVNQLIDGGNETLGGGDSLLNVLNPISDTLVPASGSSDGVAGSSNYVSQWINIENVTAFEPPVVVPGVDDPNVLTPILTFAALNPNASATVGFIGGGEPLLPCGFNTLYGTVDTLADSGDCAEENPEFLALQSSLIHFDNDSAIITTESADRLRRVSDFVVGTDIVSTVRIEGHTDDNASEAYNMALSKRRAEQAAKFMRERGVSAELMHLQYFGESLPVVPNDSDANRAINRRAVIELEAK